MRSDPRTRYYDRINILGRSLPSSGYLKQHRPYSVPKPGEKYTHTSITHTNHSHKRAKPYSPSTSTSIASSPTSSISPSSSSSSSSFSSAASSSSSSSSSTSASPSSWAQSSPNNLSPSNELILPARSISPNSPSRGISRHHQNQLQQGFVSSSSTDELAISLPPWLPPSMSSSTHSSSNSKSSSKSSSSSSSSTSTTSNVTKNTTKYFVPSPSRTTPTRARSVSVSTISTFRSDPIGIPARPNFDAISEDSSVPSDDEEEDDIFSTRDREQPFPEELHALDFDEDLDQNDPSQIQKGGKSSPPFSPSFVPPHLQTNSDDALSGARWQFKKEVERRRR